MKVLWFTNTASLYKKEGGGYNGGGWISSLESEMKTFDDIELAISFMDTETLKIRKDNVIYYPIRKRISFSEKIQSKISYTKYIAAEVNDFLAVVADFNPDIIHIFGSEQTFGLISKYTEVPIVLHLQGIMNPYLNAFFPPSIGSKEYVKYNSFKGLRGLRAVYRIFRDGAKNEREIFQNCKNYIGRTKWDEDVSRIYSPGSKYYFCGEILRNAFYKASPWTFKHREKMVITTTISRITYKGFDLLLKTADLLKNQCNLDFEWNVFGIEEYRFFERILKIKASDVNVHLRGVVDANGLVKALNDTDVFVHPSYIDNSPNSVCEAQLLGVPVISTNVGGISSLIEDGKTGVLIPTNDPYSLACRIVELKSDVDKAKLLGENARCVALERHDVKTIANRNIQIYKTILNEL